MKMNDIKMFFSSRRNLIICSAIAISLIIAAVVLCICLFNKKDQRELSVYEQVTELMNDMSVEEKIGQMIVVRQSGLKNSDITKKEIGGVVFDLDGKKFDSAEDFVKKAEKLQKKSKDIPLFYGIDADNEALLAVNETVFPSYYALGATRNSTLISACGKNTAYSLLNAGFNWCLTDLGTVPFNTSKTDCGDSFVQNVYQNGSFVKDYISGIRSMNSPNMLTCSVKGYLGKGYMGMSEYSISEDMRQAYLSTYTKAIEAGTRMIFVSDDKVDTTPCAANKQLIDTLKNELQFSGICAADENALNAVSSDFSVAFEQSINSGCDMFVLSKENKAVKTIKKLVKDGKISQERIDDAVKRILTVKVESGLFKNAVNTNASPDENQTEMQTIAVRSSPVLLKNDNDTIAKIQSAQHITVLGQAANDLSALCGVSSADAVKNGQTLYGALSELLGERVKFSTDAKDCAGSDMIIAVVEGNKPTSGRNSYLCDRDNALINSVIAMNPEAPVVLLVVCDRPTIISNIFDNVDACAVIWRPGSQCMPVAQLLTGRFKFSGLMPCSWLSGEASLPVYPDSEENAQFKFGFALNN